MKLAKLVQPWAMILPLATKSLGLFRGFHLTRFRRVGRVGACLPRDSVENPNEVAIP